jgi:hypothetical protein
LKRCRDAPARGERKNVNNKYRRHSRAPRSSNEGSRDRAPRGVGERPRGGERSSRRDGVLLRERRRAMISGDALRELYASRDASRSRLRDRLRLRLRLRDHARRGE